jgi:hypothetical protein
MEVRSVIKTQDNPPDDLYAGISEIAEELIRHFHGRDHACIIGYTLISPGPSLPPVVFRVIGDHDDYRLPYETIESDDVVFITARLPPGTTITPYVEIMQDVVRVFLDERAATIIMKSPVDVTRSHFSVRNGVLDITLTKRTKS